MDAEKFSILIVSLASQLEDAHKNYCQHCEAADRPKPQVGGDNKKYKEWIKEETRLRTEKGRIEREIIFAAKRQKEEKTD